MDEQIHNTVKQIHTSPTMASIAVSGAGSQALAWLLSVPGASRTLINAHISYSTSSTISYLGFEPQQYVSPSTATFLAASAYAHAKNHLNNTSPFIGVGCTATIITEKPKRGAHRVHIAIIDSNTVTSYALELKKGHRDRLSEESIVSQLLIHALAEASDITTAFTIDLLPVEEIVKKHQSLENTLTQLLNADHDRLLCPLPDLHIPAPPFRAAFLSGSFDPLHDGHLQLARTAAQFLNMPIVFDLSIANVDKPILPSDKIRRRLQQFSAHPYLVTLNRGSLYSEKAKLYPNSTFILGYDTASRLFDAKYYGNDQSLMLKALDDVRANNCRFLIAGRLIDGIFKTLDDLPIPPDYTDLFLGLTESEFRRDLSSTQIRQQPQNKNTPQD